MDFQLTVSVCEGLVCVAFGHNSLSINTGSETKNADNRMNRFQNKTGNKRQHTWNVKVEMSLGSGKFVLLGPFLHGLVASYRLNLGCSTPMTLASASIVTRQKNVCVLL